MTSVTDPKGQLYGFNYNPVGWLTQRTDPVARSDHYKYSRDGGLRRWTNRRGNVIEYGYDGSHRRTIKSGANTTTDTWAYPSDTVVVASNSVSVDTLLTNRHGQLQHVSTVLAGQYYRRRYVYTSAGALDSVIPSGPVEFHPRQYVWNLRRGTLTEIKLGSASTGLASNADGFPQVFTLPGGDQIALRYTSTHSEADLTTSAPYASTVNRWLSFDLSGRLDRQILGTGVEGQDFGYDGLGRLKTVAAIHYSDPGNPCTGNPPPDVDENGNICTYEGTWITDSVRTFDYDSAGNRRDEGGSYLTGNRISALAGCSYQTDEDGNVTQRVCPGETTTFVWSAESRLSSFTVNGQTTLLDYNGAGRLVRKTTSGIATHFLWERDNPLAELDGTGTVKIAEYSYYPGLDNAHALIVGTSKYFAHRDGLGNTIALTDSTKAVRRTYVYNAWGKLSDGIDYVGFAGADRIRFKGALWFGQQIELYYMRNRWYEPRSGRFLSEDPLGLAGGLNPYTYASNDPVNARDPDGLLTCAEVALIVVDEEPVPCTTELLESIDAWLKKNRGISLDAAWAKEGYTRYSRGGAEPICHTGFSDVQCRLLSGALASLLAWGNIDAQCFRLGMSAARRFRSGRFRYWEGYFRGGNVAYALNAELPFGMWFGPKTMIITSIALAENNMANVIAHEEYHFQEHDLGSFDHAINKNDRFWQMGDHCGGPRER